MQQLAQELQIPRIQKIRKNNSISTNSICSSSAMSESPSMNSSNNAILVKSRSNTVTSQSSLNREIKNLLDIAENRTKLLCKVYDSSLSDQENMNILDKSEVVPKRYMTQAKKNRYSYTSVINESSMRPNDYKSIINMNYLNSSKKQSNVITKVKLWDQLLESGHLNTDKWDKEFS